MTIAADQIEHFMAIWYVCRFCNSLFRNKRFVLNEMFQWNTSKFAIFYVKENPCSFFRFLISCNFIFLPYEGPGLCRHKDPGYIFYLKGVNNRVHFWQLLSQKICLKTKSFASYKATIQVNSELFSVHYPVSKKSPND